MPRLPGSTSITFTLSASSISAGLYTDDVNETFSIIDFNREEYSPNRLQRAKDYTTFAEPMIVKNAVNGPVQIGIEPCGFSTPLYLGPEDNYLSQILQRFNVKEARINISPSSPSAVNSLYAVYQDHRKRLDQFDAYQAELERDISYQELIILQGETFSYLTTTGLDISSVDLNLSNVLISDFSQGTVHIDFAAGIALTVGASITIQQRTIQSRV